MAWSRDTTAWAVWLTGRMRTTADLEAFLEKTSPQMSAEDARVYFGETASARGWGEIDWEEVAAFVRDLHE